MALSPKDDNYDDDKNRQEQLIMTKATNMTIIMTKMTGSDSNTRALPIKYNY